MEPFNVLDQVQLIEPIPLTGDLANAIDLPTEAPLGTLGTVVEILEPNQAFLVELFGDWVVLQPPNGLRRAEPDEPGAFRETLGVELVQAQQLALHHRLNPVKLDLFRLLDAMPDDLLTEVQMFAEFLNYRQQGTASTPLV